MGGLFASILIVGCSSDDTKEPITIDYKKGIQNKWEFKKIQLITKDNRVTIDIDSKSPFECKNQIWNFGADGINRLSSFMEDPMTGECSAYNKQTPYLIEKSLLTMVILDDGDQLFPRTFRITKLDENTMILLDPSFELTEQQVKDQKLPEGTRFKQYLAVKVK